MLIEQLLNHLRRNHALEHATINLLSRRHPGAHLVGVSGPQGFTLYSSMSAEDIIPVAREALRQLRSGNAALAVHENCGTNLVITAVLTTLATVLGLRYTPGGARTATRDTSRAWWNFLERLPQAILLNAMALVVAVPVARWVQTNVTTSPDVTRLEIVSFFTDRQGGLSRIRVHTRLSREGLRA